MNLNIIANTASFGMMVKIQLVGADEGQRKQTMHQQHQARVVNQANCCTPRTATGNFLKKENESEHDINARK